MIRRQSLTRLQTGIATVEFAITAPVLCFLLLAGAEVGRAFVQQSVLSNAARQSARFAADNNSFNELTGLPNLSAATITSARNMVVYGNAGGLGSPRLTGLTIAHVTVTVQATNDIRVLVNYPYQPMVGAVLPSFGFGPATPLNFVLQIGVSMRAIS